MATQDKAVNNGTAKDSKVVANIQAATPPKPELSNVTVSAPPPPAEPAVEKTPNLELMKLPTMEERLNKFYELERVKERRDELKDALERVEDFQISPTGGAEKLSFSSSRNAGFTITNSIVIAELVAVTKEKLKALLAEQEAKFIL